jgi:uncharacterized membrane protein YebE (DUF533 family)
MSDYKLDVLVIQLHDIARAIENNNDNSNLEELVNQLHDIAREIEQTLDINDISKGIRVDAEKLELLLRYRREVDGNRRRWT